jgi:hypothetical protein
MLMVALAGSAAKAARAPETRFHFTPLAVGSAIDPDESTRKYMSSGSGSDSMTTPPQTWSGLKTSGDSSTSPSGPPVADAPLDAALEPRAPLPPASFAELPEGCP